MARWQRKGTERVGSFGVFEVDRHVVQRDDDRPRTIHTLETVDWCNVVPVTAAGEIVLIRLHRFGIDGPSLEIPGGLIDAGEAPIEAARRELREETGFTSDDLIPLGVVRANPALQATRLHMFLARDCRPHPAGQALEDLEDCEIVVIGRSELDDRLARGEIAHALVWSALHAFALHERRAR
jgi:8-oxo-dGTP pyrophosphatase MutT (NUDIX family)